MADPLNNAIGRRGAVMVAAISKLTPPRPGLYWPRLVNAPTFPLVLIATPIGVAVTQSWQQFLAVRSGPNPLRYQHRVEGVDGTGLFGRGGSNGH